MAHGEIKPMGRCVNDTRMHGCSDDQNASRATLRVLMYRNEAGFA